MHGGREGCGQVGVKNKVEVRCRNHRITESQNSRGWKGPLWVI